MYVHTHCLHSVFPVSGYFVRKFVFDYYAQKEYLRGLVVKNEMTRQELTSHAENMHEIEAKAAEERRMEAFQEEARRKHYMMSTKSSRGPYFPSHHKCVLGHVLQCKATHTCTSLQ